MPCEPPTANSSGNSSRMRGLLRPLPWQAGLIYVGSGDRKVYALQASDGKLAWSFLTGGQVASSPAVSGGAVYVGSYDGDVYALNAQNGKEIWSYATGEMVVSSPAAADSAVYVGSYNNMLYAFGPASTAKPATAEPVSEIAVFLVLAVIAALVVFLTARRLKRKIR